MNRKLAASFSAVAVCLVAAAALSLFTGNAAPNTNWSAWRGSDGTGVSAETNLPTEWSPDKNIKWKTILPGRGHSSPIVWGNKIFLTTDVEGDVVAGAKPVPHKIEGQDFVHPDSVGGNRKHAFKVLCLDRNTGKLLWEQAAYEGTVSDDGWYKLVRLVRRRRRRAILLRPQRQAAVEDFGRQDSQRRNGARHFASA